MVNTASVRYVAPITADVLITSIFASQDLFGTTTDVHVLLNGSSVFDDFVEGVVGTSSVSFSRRLSLDRGDAVDFAVGFGRNGSFSNDSTALAATVQPNPIPEPGTLLLFSTGALMLYVLATAPRELQVSVLRPSRRFHPGFDVRRGPKVIESPWGRTTRGRSTTPESSRSSAIIPSKAYPRRRSSSIGSVTSDAG